MKRKEPSSGMSVEGGPKQKKARKSRKSEKFKKKVRANDIARVDCFEYSITELTRRLHTVDKQIDVVLLEHQPSFNLRTATMEWVTSALSPLCIRSSVLVRRIDPGMKNKYCHTQGINMAGEYKTEKARNKNETKRCFEGWLKTQSPEMQLKYQLMRKKDDVADAVVQAFAYIHYCLLHGHRSQVMHPIPDNVTKQGGGGFSIFSGDMGTNNYAVARLTNIKLDIQGKTFTATLAEIDVWDLLLNAPQELVALEDDAKEQQKKNKKKKKTYKKKTGTAVQLGFTRVPEGKDGAGQA